MFARCMAVAATLLACQGASAQTAPYIPTFSCQSSNTILNTGYDYATGQLIPNGGEDTQWWVSTTPSDPTGALGPSPDASWKPTSVPTTAALPATWVSGASLGGQTNWISPLPNATTRPRPYPFNPPLTNYYRMQFNLPAHIIPSALNLSMDYYSDDGMLGVSINGVFQPLPTSGFASGAGGTAPLNGPWQTGLNTLIFSVGDTGWGSGLLAHIKPDGLLCETSLTIQNTIDKPTFAPGETAHYAITVRNPGSSDASLVTLTNAVPPALSDIAWSCTAANGAACPASMGNAPFNFDLPPGAELVFGLSGKVAASGSLLNTSTIESGPGAVCDASTGCSATADAQIITPSVITPPQAVPGLSPWALAALSLLTVMLVWITANKRQRSRPQR